VMGKTMREYACVPAAHLGDQAFLREWFQKGLDYTRTLPAKKPKAAKRKRASVPSLKSA